MIYTVLLYVEQVFNGKNEVGIMLDFSDYLYLILTSLLKTIIFVGIAILSYYLISFNYSLGINIADVMEIPYDMASTITSIGLVNNITLLFTVFEIIFVGVVINKLNKVQFLNQLFNCFINFYQYFKVLL